MPASAPPAQPGEPPAYVSLRDRCGDLVVLRRPVPGEVLCGACLAGVLAELASIDTGAEPELPAPLRAELAAIAAGVLPGRTGPVPAEDPPADPVAALFPASGAPGHDCAAAFPAPVWLVRQDGCGRDARAHLGAHAPGADRSGCRCGVVSLFEVLEQLDGPERQRALEAHHVMLTDLYDHLMCAEELLSDAPAGHAWLDRACLACLTDPAPHLDQLDEELTARTLELAPVLRAYQVRLHLGDRRAPGPLPGPGPR